ncbi:MAG: Obg family GTPase CgtA, partial [Calditrichia bacterium]|nr:Obg family GTPase CgtA [Calditrichia bacterium]
LVDLTENQQTFIIAQGGMGGKGNKHFSSSTNRTPRFCQPGIKGIELKIKLELKLLADIGLIGLPNAGKSTLISRISKARPKIADYPFTTKIPNLGIVHIDYGKSYVIADIPGIIEGAHEGKGLGLQFLRHIERTKVLVYLIDAAEDTIEETYNTLKSELADYNKELANRPSLLILNKKDIWEHEEIFSKHPSELGHPYIGISALKDSNLTSLKHKIWELLQECEDNDEE